MIYKNIPHSSPGINDVDIQSVVECLRTGMIARGCETEAFEDELASTTGYSFTFATSSGAAAITVALKALGVGPNDEVVMPTYVCESVMHAVRASGATEILCDTGASWVMDVASVLPHIGPRTRAIIAVHIFGLAVDSAALRSSTGIPVVEDCCQALGPVADGSWIGAKGDVAVFSFHPTKCLAAGEGGMVATNCSNTAHRIATMKSSDKPLFSFCDFQAALARSQLGRYEETLRRRVQIANRYFEMLPEVYTAALRSLKHKSMFFRFPLVYQGDFDMVHQRLAGRGIQIRRGVDSLIHRKSGLPDAFFANAVRHFRETISIPILPQLSEEDVDRVIHEIRLLYQARNYERS